MFIITLDTMQAKFYNFVKFYKQAKNDNKIKARPTKPKRPNLQ